jgi:AraC-like DNA-binding protein
MNKWISAKYRKRDEKWKPLDFHSHNEFEIYIFHEGDCKYLIRDQIYHLKPGDIILMNGLTLHRANALPTEPYERSIIEFSPDWIRPVLHVLQLPELLDPFLKLNNCLLRLHTSSLKRIEELVKSIAVGIPLEGIRSQQFPPLNEGRVKTLMVQLLMEIYELNQVRLEELTTKKSEKDRHVERIVEWINQRFTSKISLDYLAAELNINKYYISHVFKEVTGSTVMDYLMNCRLQRAQYLLEMHPEKSISEVALDAGFESFAHFSRFFRQRLGATPTEYRKQRSSAISVNSIAK